MKLVIKHTGFIKNGRKVYDNPSLYTDQIISLEGKQFVEEIKEKHHSVTQNQYGYYRGAILPTCHKSEMFKHFDTKDSIHENLFAPMFLSYIVMVKLPDRKPYEQTKVRSLADLSKDEMSEFIERVIAWCENEGISIPSPEMYYNKYYQK
jgi:hypothetical protein